MQLNLSKGIMYDFTSTITGTGGGGIDNATANIIEANTGTSINEYVGYIEIEELNGLPYIVRKWVDATKTKLLYTITLTFNNGLLYTVVVYNHVSSLTKTTSIVWVDGKLFSSSSVIS
jgi:hypothetical protein